MIIRHVSSIVETSNQESADKDHDGRQDEVDSDQQSKPQIQNQILNHQNSFKQNPLSDSDLDAIRNSYQPIQVGGYHKFSHQSHQTMKPMDVNGYFKRLVIPGNPSLYKSPKLPLLLHQQWNRLSLGETSLLPMIISSLKSNINLNEFDFVTERTNLNKISMRNTKWRIGIQRIGKTIFLRRFHERNTSNFGEFGFLFEDHCTLQQRKIRNMFCEWNKIHTAKIGNFKFLIAAEIDAYDPLREIFVELKTVDKLSEYKARNMWTQSFLGGIPKVIVGFKEKIGEEETRISLIKEYETESLTNDDCKRTCFQILLKVLKFIQDNVEDNKIYLLQRGGHSIETNERPIDLFETTDSDQFISSSILEEIRHKLKKEPIK